MGSLFSALSIAVGSLQAQQAGLQTTTNNIANLNTTGYSRERPVLQEADPIVRGNLAFGDGVTLTGIESLRDRILDAQVSDELQHQAKSQSFIETMNQVQTLFPVDTSGIGASISSFFESLNGMSANPSDSTLRQNVLSAADSLASSFRDTANQLVSQRQNLDLSLQQDVQEVNQITKQIADLNAKLAASASTDRNCGSYLDQRNQLVESLSGLIDLSAIDSGNALTLTTRQGTALVVDGRSFDLDAALDPSTGRQHIYSQTSDITGQISGGKLGGLLQARDQTIASTLGQLDTLAGGLVSNLNAAHQLGFDLHGNPGGDLFTAVGGAGAAASMAVAINDPSLIAASSDGSIGSNGNLANLSAVANQGIADGKTATQAYSNVVFQVGTSITNATAEATASTNALQQLQQQADSVSGVSLDEEASNLMLYERAYQAAARAISAVDQMMQTAIQMGANQ